MGSLRMSSRFVELSLLVTLCTGLAVAQSKRGTLAGTVMDSSGGAIAGATHRHGPQTGIVYKATFNLPGQRRFSDDFHIFAVEWEPNAIRFYVDQDLHATRTPVDLPPGTKWVFDHPFFILLNLAVGGDWPGYPHPSTLFR